MGINEANLMASEEIADLTFNFIQEKEVNIKNYKEEIYQLKQSYIELNSIKIEQSSLLEEMANYLKLDIDLGILDDFYINKTQEVLNKYN